MGTTKRASMLWLVIAVTAASSAAADDRVPSSLRMRARRPARLAPQLDAPLRRVAQAPPDDPPGDAGGDQPAPPRPAARPRFAPLTSSQPVAPQPTSPQAASPKPRADARAVLASDDGKTDGKTEVINVTDASVEHERFTGRGAVSVVTRADIAASGHGTLGDILLALPAQANAGNAQVNAGGDGTTRVNLRGLGASRTLVLLDGRRIVNGGPGADAAVDVNAIPLAAIERVEILKDGASAIYGADAVGGVVNLITRSQFEGVDASLLTSTSQHGDGTEYDASLVAGYTTKDRATYLLVSGGFQRHNPVLAGDRAFSNVQTSYDFASRTATPNASSVGPGGVLDTASLGAGAMQPPGCASHRCTRTADGGWTDFAAPRDLYNEAATSYVYTPSSRYNLFATAGNRVTDSASLFLQLLFLHRNSDRQLAPAAFVADSAISKDSLYNPLGGNVLDYRRRMTELGTRLQIDHVTMVQLIGGVTGKIPERWGVLQDWKYEISQDYGYSSSVSGTTGQLLKPKFADAIGPSMIHNGEPICVRKPGDPSTQIIYIIHQLTGPPLPIPCVPLDLMAPAGGIPRDQLKNLSKDGVGNGTDNAHTTLATASGRIAELPNRGEISLSLGGDYRSEDGELVPTGVRVPDYSTDDVAETSKGRFRIFEGFGQLAIVPISGHEIAQRVEIDLGARAQRHSRYGSSVTYAAGGLFRTGYGLALRGSYATAFRAPTVPDLFLGRTERDITAEDPCDAQPPSAGAGTRTLDPAIASRCAAQGVPVDSRFGTSQQVSAIGGNPALTAETAATTTFGIVVEPPQLTGLAVSADYWHIAISDAIETLGIHTIFGNCYDRGLDGYCEQIHRDPVSGRIDSVDQRLQNVPRTVTSGVDLAVLYDASLAAVGRLRTRLEAQYLLRYDLDTSLQVLHGVGVYDLGVYPRYKANLSSNWAHPSGVSGGFNLRFVGSYQECAGDDCNNPANLAMASREVDRYVKLDVFGGYELRSSAGKTTVLLGINNLLDAAPPVVYNAPAANSDATAYDFVGRMVYLRLSQQF
jgi:outer membrane receptor protein involved in Fe transport